MDSKNTGHLFVLKTSKTVLVLYRAFTSSNHCCMYTIN